MGEPVGAPDAEAEFEAEAEADAEGDGVPEPLCGAVTEGAGAGAASEADAVDDVEPVAYTLALVVPEEKKAANSAHTSPIASAGASA